MKTRVLEVQRSVRLPLSANVSNYDALRSCHELPQIPRSEGNHACSKFRENRDEEVIELVLGPKFRILFIYLKFKKNPKTNSLAPQPQPQEHHDEDGLMGALVQVGGRLMVK